MSKTIEELLGKGRDNFAVAKRTSVRETIEFMRKHDTPAVAVTSEGRVVGVFTARDVLRRLALETLDLRKLEVGEAMSTPAYWISTHERYEVAKAIMVAKDVQQLVVLDARKRFLGFVSSKELLEADLTTSRELVAKLNDDYYERRFEPQA